MLSIEMAAKELKLAHTKTPFQEHLTQANHQNLTFEKDLTELLNAEVEVRHNRSCERRIKQAKFHQKKYLMDFDDLVFEDKTRQQLRELKTLQFIEVKEIFILIGNVVTGKTHFSIGIGIAACLKGYQVLL